MRQLRVKVLTTNNLRFNGETVKNYPPLQRLSGRFVHSRYRYQCLTPSKGLEMTVALKTQFLVYLGLVPNLAYKLNH